MGVGLSGFIILLMFLGDFADHHGMNQLLWSILGVSV